MAPAGRGRGAPHALPPLPFVGPPLALAGGPAANPLPGLPLGNLAGLPIQAGAAPPMQAIPQPPPLAPPFQLDGQGHVQLPEAMAPINALAVGGDAPGILPGLENAPALPVVQAAQPQAALAGAVVLALPQAPGPLPQLLVALPAVPPPPAAAALGDPIDIEDDEVSEGDHDRERLRKRRGGEKRRRRRSRSTSSSSSSTATSTTESSSTATSSGSDAPKKKRKAHAKHVSGGMSARIASCQLHGRGIVVGPWLATLWKLLGMCAVAELTRANSGRSCEACVGCWVNADPGWEGARRSGGRGRA